MVGDALLGEGLDRRAAKHEGHRHTPGIAEVGLDRAFGIFATGREGADLRHAFREARRETGPHALDPVWIDLVLTRDRQGRVDVETHPPVNGVGLETRRRPVMHATQIIQ